MKGMMRHFLLLLRCKKGIGHSFSLPLLLLIRFLLSSLDRLPLILILVSSSFLLGVSSHFTLFLSPSHDSISFPLGSERKKEGETEGRPRKKGRKESLSRKRRQWIRGREQEQTSSRLEERAEHLFGSSLPSSGERKDRDTRFCSSLLLPILLILLLLWWLLLFLCLSVSLSVVESMK